MDLLQQPRHLPRGRAAEPLVGRSLETKAALARGVVAREPALVDLGVRQRPVGRIEQDPDAPEQLARGREQPRLLVARLGEERVHAIHPDGPDHDVRRGVVARHDHLGDQVAIGRAEAGREGLQQAAAPAPILRAHGVALVEREPARLGVAKGEEHDRDLDDAERVHRRVRAHGHLPTRGEMLRVHRALGRQRVEEGREAGLEILVLRRDAARRRREREGESDPGGLHADILEGN